LSIQCAIPDTVMLLVEPKSIPNALVAILENALAVSKAGDTVLLSATTESKKLIITIADQGPGIASTMIDSLFEPFSTTSANGTGLGLSIAKNTLDAHRGTIGAHSTHEGALFKITLPVTQS